MKESIIKTIKEFGERICLAAYDMHNHGGMGGNTVGDELWTEIGRKRTKEDGYTRANLTRLGDRLIRAGEAISKARTTIEQKTFEKEEITNDLLASLVGKKVQALCRQYSYQSHGTWRSGTIIAHYGRNTVEYYFAAHEHYSKDDILKLKEGWE